MKIWGYTPQSEVNMKLAVGLDARPHRLLLRRLDFRDLASDDLK